MPRDRRRSVLPYFIVVVLFIVDLFIYIAFPHPRLGHRRDEFLAASFAAACKLKLPRDFLPGVRRRGNRSNVVVVEVAVVEVVVAVGWGDRRGRGDPLDHGDRHGRGD